MTDEYDLKPCPFCGSTDIKIEIDKSDKQVAVCCCNNECGIGSAFEYTKKEAIKIWNRRIK